MARVASQRFFFTKNYIFEFYQQYGKFSTFFQIKNDAHWNFVKICQIFSPWTPIWDHFVHFWMMSVPKQPPLKWSLHLRFLAVSHRVSGKVPRFTKAQKCLECTIKKPYLKPRLQLKGVVFLPFFKMFLSFLRKFIWFLIDFD
jgi:hypothetical protein